MSVKTPLFEAAIQQFFAELTPQTRICPETGDSFALTARDIETYKMFQVPPSKLVPWARIRRLRAAIGGYDLFKRTLGDGREVITMYDPESPVTLLPTKEWMDQRANDAFLKHGYVYDPTQSFFAQWESFTRSVPRPATIQDPKNVNSDWSSYCSACTNNYQCYANNSETHDIQYSDYCSMSSYCSDAFACDRVEWCYSCMRTDRTSNSLFCEWCVDCLQSWFLLSCRNCHDCFGCANLVNKSYCFLNEQLSPEDYKKRLAEIDLGDAAVLAYWRDRIIQDVWNRAFRGSALNRETEGSLGDDNIECKDVVGVGLFQAERLLNCWGSMIAKDNVDIASCFQTDWSAFSTDTTSGNGYKMSVASEGCLDVEYSELLSSCEHCFGCIGLYKKSYCIFNTQYSEEEYYKIVDQLKTKMLADGEYGEFFPYQSFLISYNASHADVMSPLSKEEVTELGGRWYEQPTNDTAGVLPIEELPIHLSETTNDVLKQSFRCPVTQRPFRIVAPELDLHRKLNVALPRLHPTLRRKLLMRKHRQLQFYPGICLTCQAPYQTRIKPEENLPIICESCYQKVLIGEHSALIDSVS